MNVEDAVLDRYSAGASERQEALCCPVDYQTDLLKLLPEEIIEKDYGCGDPSRYVRPGDTVLDLGSGSGKICYMAAQLVEESGRVIGVDMNNDMLVLARKYQQEMADRIGNDRVTFLKGKIQDLALDVEAFEKWMQDNPAAEQAAVDEWTAEQRLHNPLLKDSTIDLVISNCVLNLVNDAEKQQLVDQIYRVVKPGGRIAISDIISDELIPEHLKADEQLWSGCISGAFQELEMLQMFQNAGFIAISYDKWSAEPWQVVEGIEFRSVTLTAIKPEQTRHVDKGHAVIYRGPYEFIRDDQGNEYPRGERIAVSEATFLRLGQAPFEDDFICIEPAATCAEAEWNKPAGTRREASATKGARHANSNQQSPCC